MTNRQNPFTHTYGSAGQAYIDMGWADEVINNYNYDIPSEYVYKIIGVRGGGKTVVLSDIMRYFRNKDRTEKGWLVYDLSSARDPLHTLVSFLANENFVARKGRSSNVNITASVGILSESLNTETSLPENGPLTPSPWSIFT